MAKALNVFMSTSDLYFNDPETRGREGPFRFDPYDLEETRSGLVRAVDGLTRATPDWVYRGQDERDVVLEDLRNAGASLLAVLVGERLPDIKELLRSTTYLLCQSDVHLPWEFLYLGDVDEPTTLSRFLGANAVVGRPFDKASKTMRVRPDRLDLRDCPLTRPPPSVVQTLGYAEDFRLPSATSGSERGVFTELGIPLTNLPRLHHSGAASAETLSEFMVASEWLTHFNSHADEENPNDRSNPSKGAIYVTDSFKLDYKGIDETEVAYGSIIVLNCCSGHTMLHGIKDTVALRFIQKDVGAVVATTAAIEDAYATRWARHFYAALWSGETVPDSILAARTAMLSEEFPNPSAMLYAFLGKDTASLHRKAKRP